ncbi:hypothetical protein Syun_016292 [Stephania yunnanensis]|uniref:Uncharacterized protein n=1 Tax=Stephania yunnanensis TaxID=152371 RepID=A0AAP0P3R2_9MAGN
MEIDRAIRGSQDRRLKTKYDNAIYVIQRAFALYETEDLRLTGLKKWPSASMEGKIQLYDLQLEIIQLDFKSGLEALLREKPFKAIFLGTRYGDPNAVNESDLCINTRDSFFDIS